MALPGMVIAIAMIGDSLLYVVLPLYHAEFGLSLAMVGVLLSLNRWVRLIANSGMAHLGERIGPHALMIGAAVGSIVRAAEAEGRELGALPLSVYQAAHPLFADDVYDALSPNASIAARAVAGGTAPSAVREQLARARNLVAGTAKTPPRGNSVI